MTDNNFSLLQFILNLLGNHEAQHDFQRNPQEVLQQHGFGNLNAQDVHEVLPLVADCAQENHHSYDPNGGHHSPVPPAAHILPGESGLDSAIRQLHYITNNYTYDSYNNVLDNSIHQKIWSLGDVHQNFNDSPVVASGPGAIAAGHDIKGPIVEGDHNTVGDHNATGPGSIVGNGNQQHFGDGPTNFGSGQANDVHGVDASHGGVVSVGSGHAAGPVDDHSTHATVTDFGSGGNSNLAVTGAGGHTTQTALSDTHNTLDTHNTTLTNSQNPVNVHETSHNIDDSFNHNNTTSVLGDHQNGLVNVDHVLSHDPVDVLNHVHI